MHFNVPGSVFQVLLPLDDLYPSLYDRVLEELSNSSSGQASIQECSETIAECNSKGKNFNRLVLQSGYPPEMLCNVSFPHGQCSPVADLTKIQELGKDLQAHI